MDDAQQLSYDEWAREFVADHKRGGFRTIHYWASKYWLWEDSTHTYRSMSFEEFTDVVLSWLRAKRYADFWREAEACARCIRSDVRLIADSLPQWLGTGTTQHTWFTACHNYLVDSLGVARGSPEAYQVHTPAWFSTSILPYDYDPKAECPRWLRLMIETFGNDISAVRLLRQFFGYWITPDVSRQVALFLYGYEGSGKSTIAKVAEALIGEQNCSYLGVSEFGTRFSLTSTFGKLLNISDEVQRLSIDAEGNFKWYLGGMPMSFEHKGVDRFSAKPTARLLACVNEWPQIRDTTGAVWRRIKIIPFTHSLPEKRQNPNLVEELKQELPGILNWAIGGLADLLENGFAECKSGEELKAAKRAASQPATVYAEQMVKRTGGGFVGSKQLVEAFKRWANANAFDGRDVTEAVLVEAIERKHGRLLRGRDRVDGRQVRGIKGVELLK